MENAWTILYPGKEMPFFVQDAFDMHFIANTFKRGDIFLKSDKTFIGMLDFDDAYEKYIEVEKSNSGKTYSIYEADIQKGLCLKHRDKNGFIFLLPIPNDRMNLASIEFGKNSEVCIEYLFDNKIVKNLLEDKPQVGGGCIKVITKDTDKKLNFANNTKNFEADDFKNFKPIFEIINKITSSHLPSPSLPKHSSKT